MPSDHTVKQPPPQYPLLFFTYSDQTTPKLTYIYIDYSYVFICNKRITANTRNAAGDAIIVDEILPSGIRMIRTLKNDIRIYPDGTAIWNNQKLRQLDPNDFIITIRALASISPKPKKRNDKS